MDSNSGVITLTVYVEGDLDSAKLEKDIKHDYLMALVENFEPDALMKMTVTGINVNIGKQKPSAWRVIFFSR